MTTIRELVAKIPDLEDCMVYPAMQVPEVALPRVLPEDVRFFYESYSSAILYVNSMFPVTIVKPEEFIQVNYEALIGLSPAELESTKSHFSWSWYLMAKYAPSEYICIDCDQTRLGYCYYSFWDSHARRGSSPIVARSFTDFLENVILCKGQDWYWNLPEFPNLGDAYDLLESTNTS